MANYGKLVDKVIVESDILILVIDARKALESINKKLESRVKQLGKKFLYAINKVDLLSKAEQNNLPYIPNSIQISAVAHLGTMRLLRKIMEIGKGEDVVVGIIGYPNVGKSAVINALKGKASASTSPVSGHTKGLQKVRISGKILLIDTPGVFESAKDRGITNVVIGSIDSQKLKDPEGAAADLIKELDGKIERFFGVRKGQDYISTIEKIALKKNLVKKGGVPDTERMGKEIIRMWQLGKIK